MKFEDVKIGMLVKISMLNCEKTQRNFGLTDDMKRLKGKEFKVSGTILERKAVRITGFSWHAEDIIDISKIEKKKVKPILFDDSLLWTE